MKKYSSYIFYTLLLLWCLVIFYLSSQTSDVSGGNSLDVLSHILPGFSNDVLIGLNSIFREFMHSGVFFVLGILAYISFRNNISEFFIFSLLFCMLYALSDEVHQLFVRGRAFELIDLTLDFIGSLVGIYLVKFFERMFSND